ncbi:flavodoxin-dependent (E)-4-hydroxy-3-methylbut-2-enyl-diphosphate synthase [bacterium]|nr:flavodoxin-dependent (E)-4-hydroxy-3-methylbut-2-enyl-diphosphate synthase [candidate division CSSED10-310 bacterium]
MTDIGITRPRRICRTVKIGDRFIGPDYPVLVQSMTNTDPHDAETSLDQIRSAAMAGAELMRVSVPDERSLVALKIVTAQSPVPIAADIHFDHRLAMGALECGVAKLRINPGNIGSKSKVREIVKAASDRGIPIRVGVNAGSLEKHLLRKYGRPTAEALAESARINAAVLQEMGFNDVVISLKSSDVGTGVQAYRLIVGQTDLPLHIGITEAGTLLTGAVRSAVGLGILLSEGIGDTIRVSLAADPVEEVRVGYRILESLGLRRCGPLVIACPTCGRTRIDVIGLARDVEAELADRTVPLSVAVMGCAVNGPGEAREADLGIAGGVGEGLLFRKGKPIRKVPEAEILSALLEEFDRIAAENGGD